MRACRTNRRAGPTHGGMTASNQYHGIDHSDETLNPGSHVESATVRSQTQELFRRSQGSADRTLAHSGYECWVWSVEATRSESRNQTRRAGSQYARLNRTPREARRSTFGVIARSSPYNRGVFAHSRDEENVGSSATAGRSDRERRGSGVGPAISEGLRTQSFSSNVATELTNRTEPTLIRG